MIQLKDVDIQVIDLFLTPLSLYIVFLVLIILTALIWIGMQNSMA